jgi:hypothetical protein
LKRLSFSQESTSLSHERTLPSLYARSFVLISELEEGKQIDTASASLKIHEGLTRKLGLGTEGDAPATAQIRAEVEGLAQGQAEPMTLRSSFGTIDVLWQRARGAIWWDPAPAPVPASQHIVQ